MYNLVVVRQAWWWRVMHRACSSSLTNVYPGRLLAAWPARLYTPEQTVQ